MDARDWPDGGWAMDGAHCGHHNDADAKFCSECGAPLAVACTACSAPQAAGSKFCNQCGTPMRLGTGPSPVAPTASSPVTSTGIERAPAAVRKNVTALFADLVGSTSFGEQLDPEAARAALRPYYEILRSTVEDRAGTVVKFTGDGVLALFGVPEVAEDDAFRAVATGIDLQRRFGEFAQQINDRHGVELGLRVGINSGELVIGDGDDEMFGDVLNTAARLESACTSGRVMVGEDTWRLTRTSFEYEVLGEVRVKGKAEPVATFQVVDHGGDDPLVEESIPFVGREAEMLQLSGAFDEVRRSRRLRLVTIIGPPGVGKTRLAQELRAATGTTSYDLRFERRGSTTFGPIADLLRDVADGTVDGVDRLFAEHPERGRLVPILQSFLGQGEARSTEESFWATRRLFEHLAEVSGPLVVVVDDIQWAEPRFWDLLDHLVEWAEAPVLITALARPELRELRPELAQAGRRVAAAVALEGLDAAATLQLAARLLGTDDLPGELVARIPDTTEGNPLFVRELVQMLVDDGTLARVGDRWRLTIDVEAIEVPPSVLSLLATRVERLPHDEREVIELASVIGTEFDRGAIEAIAPPDAAGRLGAMLDRLRRKDLIEPSGAWIGDQPQYRFHHVLIRDAAYRRLLKVRRADLHELVGRHAEHSGGGGDRLDVMVAHHFEQAVRFRTELGDVDEATQQLAMAAVQRLRRAAETALAREDLPSAGGYATRALAMVDQADPVRDELLVLACEALLSSGDVERATPFVRELHDRSGNERLAAWADCFRAQRWSYTDPDRLAEAAELTDAAARRLAELGDDAGVGRARLVRAGCLARMGRVGDCERELDLALGAARSAGDRRRTVAVLGAAPLAALWGPSPVARAGGRCLDVLRLLRITTASPAVEATSIRCQGMLEALRGRFDSARDKLEVSRTMTRDLGHRHGLFETELFAGFVELWADDPAAAEPHLRAAYEGLGRLGLGADAGQAGALLARSLHRQGRVDEAEPLAQEAADSAGQNLQTAMEARAILAEVRSLQGRHDEARRLVDEAVAIADRTDDVLDQALVHLAAARIAEAAGDAARAAHHRAGADQRLEAKGVAISRRTVEQPAPPDPTPADSRPPPESGTVTGHEAGIVPPSSCPPLTNRAWELTQRGNELLARGDRVACEALFAPDLQCIAHELVMGTVDDRAWFDGEEIFDLLVPPGQPAVAAAEHEVIAVRGDELCLWRVVWVFADGGVHDRLVLYEWVAGQVSYAEIWPPHQLIDALDGLGERWLIHGAPPLWVDISRRARQAFAVPGFDRELLPFADDFVTVDHRPMGMGERDLASFLRSSDLLTPSDLVEPQHYAASGDVGLYEYKILRRDDDFVWHVLHVNVMDDQGVHQNHVFGLDQFDEATSFFHELVAARAKSSPRPPMTNSAVEVWQRFGELLRAGDRTGLRRLVDAGYESTQRSPLVSIDPTRRGESAISDDELRLSEGTFVPEWELVAVRGDDLCLVRFMLDESGWERSRLALVQTVDGRLRSSDYFDADQLTEAQLELDRRYFTSLGLLHDHVLLRAAHVGYSMDPETLGEWLHPDIEFVEHRPLKSGGGGGADVMSQVRSVDDSYQVLIPRFLAVRDRGMLFERVERLTSEVGEHHSLVLAWFEGGLLRDLELFEPDDVDAATARFDELERARSVDAGHGDTRDRDPVLLPNAAWRTRQAIEAATDRIDRDELYELIAPDFRLTLHAEAPVQDQGRSEYVSACLDDRHRTPGRTPLEWRGDHVCLYRSSFESGDGSTSDRFVVIRTDDEHRLIESHRFDAGRRRDAQDLLDRLGAEETGSYQLARMRRSITEAWEGDAEVFESLLADDFVRVDHRQLGLGEVGRKAFIEAMESWTAPSGGALYVPAAIDMLDDRVALTSVRGEFADDFVIELLVLNHCEDGKILRQETFDVADLVSARRRFTEFVAQLSRVTGASAGPGERGR